MNQKDNEMIDYLLHYGAHLKNPFHIEVGKYMEKRLNLLTAFVEAHQSEYDEFIKRRRQELFLKLRKHKVGNKSSDDDILTVLNYDTYDKYCDFFNNLSVYDLEFFNEEKYNEIWKEYKSLIESELFIL